MHSPDRVTKVPWEDKTQADELRCFKPALQGSYMRHSAPIRRPTQHRRREAAQNSWRRPVLVYVVQYIHLGVNRSFHHSFLMISSFQVYCDRIDQAQGLWRVRSKAGQLKQVKSSAGRDLVTHRYPARSPGWAWRLIITRSRSSPGPLFRMVIRLWGWRRTAWTGMSRSPVGFLAFRLYRLVRQSPRPRTRLHMIALCYDPLHACCFLI